MGGRQWFESARLTAVVLVGPAALHGLKRAHLRLAALALAIPAVVAGGGPEAQAATAPAHPPVPARAAADGWLAQGQQLARRHALVVGNGAYQEGPLANPVNDAADMTRALRELGFEVTVLNNADKRALLTALRQFNERLRQGEMGLFFYAGHGVQVAGENYLIPVDAQLALQADVEIDAIDLRKVLNAMDGNNAAVKIVILDACRDNPFYRRWRSSGRAMPSRGLAETRQTGSGTIIAFATAPGQTAADGQPGSRNSPYTAALLKHLRTPGLNIQMMFNYVRSDVSRTTQGKQMPWEQASLFGEVVLNPPQARDPVVSAPAATVAARPPEPAVRQPEPAVKQPSPPAASTAAPSSPQMAIPQAPSSGQLTDTLFRGHTGNVTSVAWSPDGRRIVSGSYDNTLQLWDGANGKPIGAPLKGHTGIVSSVAWSPDGRRIVSGSWDDTLRLWDGASGKPIGAPLKGHIEPVISVAWSPDGRRIVSGSYDNTLRLWDGANGRPVGAPLKGHTSSVSSVAWSPDGTFFVSGSSDHTLRIWPTTGQVSDHLILGTPSQPGPPAIPPP